MNRIAKAACLTVAWAWLGLPSAWAHKGSDAYLDVQEQTTAHSTLSEAPLRQYQLKLAVALKDLDLILLLDANADGQVTWGEVKVATPLVIATLDQAAQLEAPAGPSSCALQWQYDGVERRSDGAYLRLASHVQCSLAQGLTLRYTLFKDQDASHRLLVAGHVGGQDLLSTATPQQAAGIVLVKAGAATSAGGLNPQKQASAGRWSSLVDYFSVGMHHLLEGYDHLAFLLALVLPMQLRFGSLLSFRRHAPVDTLTSQKTVWMNLFRTVTAFTVGHSVTLIIATLGWLQASPSWVEPMIALSIVVTALLNLRPIAGLRTDVLALLFGLIHGFGFAGLLQEAAVPTGLLPWALAGFNGGIEVGQLLVVGLWVVVSQALVRWTLYNRVVVRGGSVALALLASGWFLQRVS